MTTKTRHIAILPVAEDPGGSLPAIVVPRLMRIQDAAKYLSATTWQVETLLREKSILPLCWGTAAWLTDWNLIAMSKGETPWPERKARSRGKRKSSFH